MQDDAAVHYLSVEEAQDLVADARAFQIKTWPNTELLNAGGRPFEEWVILIDTYMGRLKTVYTDTAGNLPDGTPNIVGRKRIEKYAAIVANLSLWMVQSALGTAGQQD